MRRIRMRTAHRAGVRAIVTSAVGRADWDDALECAGEIAGAQHTPAIFCALGLHPYAVSPSAEHNRETLAQLEARMLARENDEDARTKWIALGECGLDFRKGMPFASAQLQGEVFVSQLKLAAAHDLPCVIHCVKAHGRMIELLAEHPVRPSVMHAFSGSAEVAERLCAMGHYISFAGNLTRGDAKRLHAAARAVPSERLLIETDSPDQTPQGRGAVPNEPAFVVDIVRALAHHRGEEPDALARRTFENACRVYQLDSAESPLP